MAFKTNDSNVADLNVDEKDCEKENNLAEHLIVSTSKNEFATPNADLYVPGQSVESNDVNNTSEVSRDTNEDKAEIDESDGHSTPEEQEETTNEETTTAEGVVHSVRINLGWKGVQG